MAVNDWKLDIDWRFVSTFDRFPERENLCSRHTPATILNVRRSDRSHGKRKRYIIITIV